MSLHQIVYISSTVRDYNESELCEMLYEFRKHNLAHQITGILLYKKFRFMQLLEGEEATISEIFAKIADDNRHRDVFEIYNAPAIARHFSDWSMSFYNLGKIQTLEVPGYSDYLDTDLDSGIFKNNDETFKFLRIFKLSTLRI